MVVVARLVDKVSVRPSLTRYKLSFDGRTDGRMVVCLFSVCLYFSILVFSTWNTHDVLYHKTVYSRPIPICILEKDTNTPMWTGVERMYYLRSVFIDILSWRRG